MNGIFVTGTDTGVGKTVVTGLLGKYLLEKQYKVIAQKWIQTGGAGFSSDIKAHLEIMGKDKSEIKRYFPYALPYAFRFPGSAHLASKIENRRIEIKKIKRSFKFLSGKFDLVIVEGLGGALVPLNQKYLLIDIVKDLDLPVLVVAQNKLGAINHTLLTIEALKRRKIKIFGIVFNNLNEENKYILEDNPRIIKKISNQLILGVLPWRKNLGELYDDFSPIGNRIYKCLRTIGLKKT